MAVHNETSTGTTSRVPEIRAAIDAAGHDALLLVDTISSLASYDFRMDEWGVDLVIGGSQKGLMLPPGMAFTAIDARAWEASRVGRAARAATGMERPMVENGRRGWLAARLPSRHLYGLTEASLDMIEEEGLENVFARHHRLANATRALRAPLGGRAGGVEIWSLDPEAASDSLTAVLMPAGHDAEPRAQDRRGALRRGARRAAWPRCRGRSSASGTWGISTSRCWLGALCGVEMGLRAGAACDDRARRRAPRSSCSEAASVPA